MEDIYSSSESEVDFDIDSNLKSKNKIEPDSSQSDDEEEIMKSKKHIQAKSTYEKSVEDDRNLIKEMERENVGEKPWYLTGEVTKEDRPETSYFWEDFDVNAAPIQKPKQTDAFNKKIEALVLDRIKRKAFDDPVRKVKPPVVDTNIYKEKFQVDETKNKKSLGDIYIEEYLKKREGTFKETPDFLLTGYVAPKDEPTRLKNLRYKVAHLFRILDALTNKHHTPYLTMEDDEEIESGAAAMAVEEATPITTSDGMMLAPEEINARTNRDMKGENEKTKTDRNRQRRKKKAYQRQQQKKEDDKLNKQLKAPTSKAAHAQESVKFVQKAVKRGHVKVLENKQPKAVKTSKAFFAAIEEKISNEAPRKKRKIK